MKKTRPVPSLTEMLRLKKIPEDFAKLKRFEQGKESILHYMFNKDGSPARTQSRNFTSDADRPESYAFSWISGEKNLPIVPYGYFDVMNSNTISELYLGEGATDGLTSNYIGLDYIGFHGANNTPESIVLEVVGKSSRIIIMKEADDAGNKFCKKISEILKKNNYKGEVSVVEFKEEAKDISEVFIARDADKVATLEELKKLTKTINLYAKEEATAQLKNQVTNSTRVFLSNNMCAQLCTDKMRIEHVEMRYDERTDKLIITDIKPITNFYLAVTGETTTRIGSEARREFTVKFLQKKDEVVYEKTFNVSAEDFNDHRKLFKIVEANVGSRAQIFQSQATFAAKVLAASVSELNERELYPTGGIQLDGSYVVNNCRIKTDGIDFGDSYIFDNGVDKAKVIGFKKMDKTDALVLFKKVIELFFMAFGELPATLSAIFPMLAGILNIRPEFMADIHGGIETVSDQGGGKTTLAKLRMRFFAETFEDEDFIRANDTLAAMQSMASSYNGAAMSVNDIKPASGTVPLDKFGEIMQNMIDGTPYTKMGEKNKATTYIPFDGLIIWNGQIALTDIVSSLATRAITETPVHGESLAAFAEINKLSSDFCGITPWLIQHLLESETQNKLRLDYDRHLAELRGRLKAEFSIERLLKFYALTLAVADCNFELVKTISFDDPRSLENLMRQHSLAVSTLYSACEARIVALEDSDIVLKAFKMLVQGMHAGQLFLGEEKPHTASSTALRLGDSPNFVTNVVCINAGAAMEYFNRMRSNNPPVSG